MSEPCNFFFVCCIIVLYSYLFGSSPRFFFFCSFCSLWCKNDIGMSSVKCPCSFVAFVFDWVISKIFFVVVVLFVRYGVKTTLEGRQWSVLVLLLLNIDGPAMLSVFFFLSHGNVSLKIFYLWESRKKVGENGAELGEGGSFAVPNVHRNPSMVADNKLLVLTQFFFL